MKTWVRYTLISTISVAVIGGTTFGVQRWAYAQGIKEVNAGGPQGIKKGLGYLELADALGNCKVVPRYAEFQDKLGIFYNQGQGVQQDYAKAFKWFKKAADQGYANAQSNLGVCYFLGQGVPQDYTIAYKWFQEAAKQDHSGAEFNIGVLFQNGLGYPKDMSSAVRWYRKAANQGHPGAQKALNDLGVAQDDTAERAADEAKRIAGEAKLQAERAAQQAEDAIPLYTAEDLARQFSSNAGRFISELSGKKIRMAGKLGFIGSNSVIIFNNDFTCFEVDGLYNLADFHKGERVTITCIFTGDGSFDESTKMASFPFHGVSIRK